MKNSVHIFRGRIAFPDIFEAQEVQGRLRFGCQLLVPKDSAEATTINAAVDTLIKGAKLGRVPPEKLCVKDGDNYEYEGFPGNIVLRCGNVKRPAVVDADLKPLTAADGKIYSGCRVAIRVELWAQDNEYGKRVNANLLGVQFQRDDEPFGGGAQPGADGFEAVGSDGPAPF